MKDKSGLDQCGNSGGHKKWSKSECVLKGELADKFSHRLGMGYERNRSQELCQGLWPKCLF